MTALLEAALTYAAVHLLVFPLVPDFDEIAPSHWLPQGLRTAPTIAHHYSGDLRPRKWGSRVSLRGSNPKPLTVRFGSKAHQPFFQRSQSSALCCGVNHIRAVPSIAHLLL
jgi:hypothetical protein